METIDCLLYINALWPGIYFIIQFLGIKSSEYWISTGSKAAQGLALVFYVLLLGYWLTSPEPALHTEQFQLFSWGNYTFNLNMYFDKTTAVFLGLSTCIGLIIIQFSSFYMHLEKGFFRFYSTIQLFLGGFTLVVMSGNLETLLAGWEIIGISSFLLIAFYRDRYLPARNAVRVFSVYRLGDLGILMAMWASHHYWHQNVSFYQMQFIPMPTLPLNHPNLLLLVLGIGFLLASGIKSAQFPFSTWLPRAMEGPTPSSAIFYGALSVHLGAFLLLRTSPFWLELTSIRWAIGIIGGISFLLGFFTSLFQPTIKAKIAYQSIMHLGLIFVEIALDFHQMALIHIALNALYRTHQLLSSPSVINIKMRKVLMHGYADTRGLKQLFFNYKLGWWIFSKSLKEWNLDSIINRYFFGIPKGIGTRLNGVFQQKFKGWFWQLTMLIPLLLFGTLSGIPNFQTDVNYVPIAMGFLLICLAFVENESLVRGIVSIFLANLFLLISVDIHYNLPLTIIGLHLSGIIPAALSLFFLARWLKLHYPEYKLSQYNGIASSSPKIAGVFLMSMLMFIGFPISPTFIGEDLLFSQIDHHDYPISIFTAIIYILTGITGLRWFARIFLGHPFSSTNLKFN
ncbi:MAG: proton-conducting transporter membrane subunit [Bacteroidia bacterium]